jgi:predicted ATPase
MNILRSARIEGLWGDKDKRVELSFDPSVNFLIGANGSGKTTVLNLIASALSSDYDGLVRSPFSMLECVLYSPKTDAETTIGVFRNADEHSPRTSFNYVIHSKTDSHQNFELISPTPRYVLHSSVRQRNLLSSQFFDGDESPINELVNVKWVSVHRTPSKSRSDDRTSTESSVDRRLTSLSNQLVRYFSKLAAFRERETTRFLRQVLSALVYNASEFNPLAEHVEAVDLPHLQASIEDLIGTFLGAGAAKTTDRLKEHFQLAAKAQAASKGEGMRLQELIALAAVLPMQRMVEEWKNTQARQEDIARPQTNFMEVINSMYTNKVLSLTQRNELEIELRSGRHLPLSELSSGEKQLLILFSEALLQERKEFIYIADEPELSLHVNWQEQLTRNLLKINPNAQVIFATHSPDIVSQFGKNTIDMERSIS